MIRAAFRTGNDMVKGEIYHLEVQGQLVTSREVLATVAMQNKTQRFVDLIKYQVDQA